MNDYLEKALELQRAGEPFVLATVVRAERPTSAKPGAKALITRNGTLSGWVGGSCARPTVVRKAKEALRDGRPRLLRLSPPERLGGGVPPDGVEEVPLTCVSGGTLEIYLEPHVPKPHLIVVGHLAVSEALVSLGKDLGYRVTVMSPEASEEQFPRADEVTREIDFSRWPQRGDRYVVVASHGNYDDEALEGALATDAWVTLVTSPKRARSVLEDLRLARVPAERLERLKYPAGLDLGAVTPEEIALSILAEIVQMRRQGTATVTGGMTSGREDVEALEVEAKDPVCGMMVERSSARYTSAHGGQTYYFCCSGCKRSFDREPHTYLVGK